MAVPAKEQGLMTHKENLLRARQVWGQLPTSARKTLRQLSTAFGLSVMAGHLQMIDGRWYVTHAGLLSICEKRRCSGICASVQRSLSDPLNSRWVFKAIVYKTPRSRGFVGYGDADPSNVPAHLRGCELRIAETRAVNRALRKAYGIGLCSVEELGAFSAPAPRESGDAFRFPTRPNGNGSNGRPRLKDRLCQLIRQYKLDAGSVKLYAAEFCGTQQLRDASREMVQDFLNHLAEWAARDLDGLVCHLNRYAPSPSSSQEVHPS